VRHTFYSHVELPLSFISESSSLGEIRFNPDQTDWTDDNIKRIRTILRKLTAGRIYNSTDAEDLVQETLLTMISKPPDIVLEKGLLAWGMGILRKKVGNYYRKVQRYTSLSPQEEGAQSCMCAPSPETNLFQEELQAIVKEILSQFPLPQRQAMELQIDGFNSGEIAKLLHPIRYQNVINSLYRGRKKLAKELEKYGYVPNALAGMTRMKMGRGKHRSPISEPSKAVK
jgi:RNA polymerase sigma factor (sigma-70 family)